MKKYCRFALLMSLGLLLATGCGNSKAAEEKVAADGSTSMEKVIGGLGESFQEKNPEISFTYNPTGSSSGIAAVNEGRCDIGLSSRSLKEEEKEMGLKEIVLAYDGIAVIVHPENQVSNLTMDQVGEIFTGKIKNWKEVGGSDQEIVLIGREAGSGTRDGFESITGSEGQCKYRQELTSTGDVLTTVKENPAAVGYVSLASVKDSVKLVKVDGIMPSEETIKDGSYQIQRPFVMVIKEGKDLSEAAQKFIDYTAGEAGNEIIKAAGVVPAGE